MSPFPVEMSSKSLLHPLLMVWSPICRSRERNARPVKMPKGCLVHVCLTILPMSIVLGCPISSSQCH